MTKEEKFKELEQDLIKIDDERFRFECLKLNDNIEIKEIDRYIESKGFHTEANEWYESEENIFKKILLYGLSYSLAYTSRIHEDSTILPIVNSLMELFKSVNTRFYSNYTIDMIAKDYCGGIPNISDSTFDIAFVVVVPNEYMFFICIEDED